MPRARTWILGAILCAANAAKANPHALPFTYPSESLPKGAMELEQYFDLSPVKYIDTTGAKAWTLKSILTTEYEYGISNKLELGLYVQLSNDTGASSGTTPMQFDGVKQRLRYRFAAPGQWPVDVSVYFEVAELTTELELEAKLNFQRRFGLLTLMANLWAEHEFYYNGINEWVLNPTGGATYQIHPMFHLGLEFWMHAELGQNAVDPVTAFNAAPHYYAGPTALLMFGRFWWSTGAYLRFDGIHDTSLPGEVYGHCWVRTMLGVD